MKLVRLLKNIGLVLIGIYLLAAVLYAVPGVRGALDDTIAVKFGEPDPTLGADYSNGLTSAQKESFYHLSQGSEILPWTLLTAVEVADKTSTRPFVEDLKRFGLLPDR